MPQDKQDRLVEVNWGDHPQTQAVDVFIQAIDRSGLLRDITQILSNEHINIQQATTQSNPKDHTVNVTLTLEISDTVQLTHTLHKNNQLPNILGARRN